MAPIKHFSFLADIFAYNRNDKWYGKSLQPRAFLLNVKLTRAHGIFSDTRRLSNRGGGDSRHFAYNRNDEWYGESLQPRTFY
jgi:hypothetical protein